MRQSFHRLAACIAEATGSPWAFGTAIILIVAWVASGPVFGFSDTWQLVVNTGTTIITFLMVFLIQNAQNRDSQAVQIKLDELLRALEGARTAIINIEDLSEEDLAQLRKQFQELGKNGDDCV